MVAELRQVRDPVERNIQFFDESEPTDPRKIGDSASNDAKRTNLPSRTQTPKRFDVAEVQLQLL